MLFSNKLLFRPINCAILLILLVYPILIFCQTSNQITLGEIWQKGIYFAKESQEFKFSQDSSSYYSTFVDTSNGDIVIRKHKIIDQSYINFVNIGALTYNHQPLEIDNFELIANESKIIFFTQTEQVYRRSSISKCFIYDLNKKSLKLLSNTPYQSNVVCSPANDKIAFTFANNLYVYDIASTKTIPLTTDGAAGKIINGSTDWVYEEEFEFTQGFDWSPDGAQIAYYKFDETDVPVYDMQVWGGQLYPTNYSYKYPKAGEANAKVRLYTHHLKSSKTTKINIAETTYEYIPRMKWSKDNNIVALVTLNRLQNNYTLYHYNTKTQKLQSVYNEKDKAYIEINDHLYYLNSNQGFLLSSEIDGYRHIYHYDMNGKLVKQITSGKWEIIELLGFDEKSKQLYYTANEGNILNKNLYSINLDGSNKMLRTATPDATHQITFNPSFDFYIDQWSTLNQPPIAAMFDVQSRKLYDLVDNAILATTLKNKAIADATFFQFTTSKSSILNGFKILPKKTDLAKKLPVLLYVYGGPGSQEVKNEWMGPNYAWFQMLAQQGVAVVCIDGRGTGGRGCDFKKCTQNSIGNLEIEDVIETAKYLGTQQEFDKERIGIFGWSFGGYMASLAMTVGAEYFKMGIAVAPVTSWRFYDTIYTERFLGLPTDNAKGYDTYSPLYYADRLKGAYLLIHGTADDNVHLQNAVEMERALIKANKPFTSFHYPDKNHGIYGGNTRMHLYEMMTKFIEKNL